MTVDASNSKKNNQDKAKRRRRRPVGFAALLVAIVGLGLFLASVVSNNLGLEERNVALGATFSKPYAEQLGLDWKTTYTAVLDDLNVRLLRIPAYWNDIEPEPDVFNFSNVDWQIDEAARRGAKVILAIGRKLPRWPECHVPTWAEGMNEGLIQTRILSMLESVVRHYAKNSTVVAWQVENEPFFKFGLCPNADRAFLKHEVAVVRALDSHPIVITESGELSTWIDAANIADILGISTYRIVWHKYIGYFYWPITPLYYRRRADVVSSFIDKFIITELQAEPWVTAPIVSMPIDEQLKFMNPQRLKDNIVFARKIGFSEAYLWGVEWWYWLKTKGHPELWEAGKKIIAPAAVKGQP